MPTPVEVPSPGPGSVSEETVPRLDLVVKEPALRLKIVITLTKVVIGIFIKNNEMKCRHLDHRVQPGRDLHTLYQGDILPPLHPRQSPSMAYTDQKRSLWRSLS